MCVKSQPAGACSILESVTDILFRGRMGNLYILGFCMDDSADAHRKNVFTVAGFLAYGPAIFDLERKWETRVKRDGIDYFKAYEANAMEGEFRKLADKHGLQTARVLADAMVRDLKTIVGQSKLAVFAVAVLMDEFRAAIENPDARLVLSADPYIAAHQQMFVLVADAAMGLNPPQGVAFIFDEHMKARLLVDAWEEFKENNPVCGKYMTTLAPLDDKLTPALQASDLLANAITGYYVAKKYDPEKAEAAIRDWLPETKRLFFWTKDYLLKYVVPENLEKAKAKVEAKAKAKAQIEARNPRKTRKQ